MTLIKYTPPVMGGGSGIRNGVLSAPSEIFWATSGLNVGIAIETIVSIAKGFDGSGNPLDKIINISANNAYWSIPANSKRYLWIDASGNFGASPLPWYVASQVDPILPYPVIESFTQSGTGVALSNINRTVFFSSSSWRSAKIESPYSGNKVYAEFLYAGGPFVQFGVMTPSETLDNYVGASTSGFGYHVNGSKYINGVSSSFGTALSVGDIIGIALDRSTGRVWASRNGTWQGSGNPGTGVNPAATLTGGSTLVFAASVYNSSTVTIMPDLFYSPPTGFNAPQNGTHLYIPRLGRTQELVSGNWVNQDRLFLGEATSDASTLSELIMYPVGGKKRVPLYFTANADIFFKTNMGSEFSSFSVRYPPGASGSVVGVGKNLIVARSSVAGNGVAILDRGY